MAAPDASETPGELSSEIEDKVCRLRQLLAARDLDAILLSRVSSFAWATGGVASAINTATDVGVGALLVTRDARYLVTDAIEAPRFEREDGLVDAGWVPLVGPWHGRNDALAGRLAGLRLAADLVLPGAPPGTVDLGVEVAHLRAGLMPVEGERLRDVGRRCGEAIEAAARRVRPGQREEEIAALVAGEAFARGVWPVVNLVATDERIRAFRHPPPTDRRLERHAMLVLCGRRRGLVCSATRLVHVGRLSDDLAARQRAVVEVDAALHAATRPGAVVADIFARAVRRYREVGFADEWRLHHQGGAAGYEPRELLARPDSTDVVALGQAYAWNPSITGTKSEDTILVGPAASEVVTATGAWPTIAVDVDGQRHARPAVLEI